MSRAATPSARARANASRIGPVQEPNVSTAISPSPSMARPVVARIELRELARALVHLGEVVRRLRGRQAALVVLQAVGGVGEARLPGSDIGDTPDSVTA